MGVSYPWVLLIASMFTAASVLSFPGDAHAEQAKIDVSAKSTAGGSAKIKVECANDCTGQAGSASGKVQCSNGDVSRKSVVNCATTSPGIIAFYSGASGTSGCAGGRLEAQWTPLPSSVTCGITPSLTIDFDTRDAIKGALDTEPVL